MLHSGIAFVLVANPSPNPDPNPHPHQALSLVPSARVAFCGDFVETAGEGGAARAGTVEGAALSGLRLAAQLERVL